MPPSHEAQLRLEIIKSHRLVLVITSAPDRHDDDNLRTGSIDPYTRAPSVIDMSDADHGSDR